MLIRNFSATCGDGDMGEEANRRALGIYDARRTIYVFVDKLSYEAKNYKFAKAAIINECAYDSEKYMTGLRRSGAHIVRKAVYFGTIVCGMPGNIQSPGSFFTLDNSITSEKDVILGKDVISHGSAVFSSRLQNMDNDERLCVEIPKDIWTLPPQYYTEMMMCKDTGDFYDLNTETFACKVPIDELIDHSTTYQFMDIDKYDTMRLELAGSMVKAESKFDKSIQVPQSVGTAFNGFEGRGSIFIYDSDAFGFGKDGVNVKGGYFPQGKFYDKGWVANNLANTLDFFRMECKDVEEMYGHVRVLYNPDALGNKFKIRFKDYNVSPITPLGKVDNNGDIDATKSDCVTSGLDTGYVTDRSVADSISLANKSNMYDFMKNMQGW